MWTSCAQKAEEIVVENPRSQAGHHVPKCGANSATPFVAVLLPLLHRHQSLCLDPYIGVSDAKRRWRHCTAIEPEAYASSI